MQRKAFFVTLSTDLNWMQGDYYFKFDAINEDGRRIYCLETNIRLVERDDNNDDDNGALLEL